MTRQSRVTCVEDKEKFKNPKKTLASKTSSRNPTSLEATHSYSHGVERVNVHGIPRANAFIFGVPYVQQITATLALGVAALCLFPGCDLGNRNQPPAIKTTDQGTIPKGSAGPVVSVLDAGVMLANNQIVRHTFTITNPTSKPIRILRTHAHMPC